MLNSCQHGLECLASARRRRRGVWVTLWWKRCTRTYWTCGVCSWNSPPGTSLSPLMYSVHSVRGSHLLLWGFTPELLIEVPIFVFGKVFLCTWQFKKVFRTFYEILENRKFIVLSWNLNGVSFFGLSSVAFWNKYRLCFLLCLKLVLGFGNFNQRFLLLDLFVCFCNEKVMGWSKKVIWSRREVGVLDGKD